jgi:alpha-L-fucosidase
MRLSRFYRVVASMVVTVGATTGLPVSASGAEGSPVGLAVDKGPFQADWESLKSQYQVPDWFRDAKFGIWAHWGPQCQPEQGDWYARYMYMQKVPGWAARVDEFHRRTYGHPSTFGFKDVINVWKAENWDPDKLMALYKRAGAQYFFALANHHDNFDLWDSKY